MSIPSRMCAVGYDSWYVRLYRELCQLLGSPKKFELGWVASENKLVIHTDRVDDVTLTEVAALAATLVPAEIEVVYYNHNMEISWRDINKYAECTSIAQIKAINPDFANDLTSAGEWIYPLPKLQDISNPENKLPKWPNGVKIWKSDLPSLTNITNMFKYNETLIEFHGALPAVIRAYHHQAFESNVFKKFAGSLSNLIMGDQFFWYCVNMEEFVSDLSKLSSGSLMFNYSKLNKESVLHITNGIPAYTSGSHPLTIGINAILQNDPEVLAAISNAEAKGWTLKVQWR